MSTAVKKMGNEEITKEFEIPKELFNYSPTDATNVVPLKKEAPSPEQFQETPQLTLDSSITAAPSLSRRVTPELDKVVEVLHQLVKRTSSFEKRVLSEMVKLNTDSKPSHDVSPIKKTVLDTVSLSTKKLQQEVKKRSEEQQAFLKSQIELLVKELGQRDFGSLPGETPKLNVVVDIPNFTGDLQTAREVLNEDVKRISAEIQELMKQKVLLDAYVFDFRQEFDNKEKALKELELKRNELKSEVSLLEEEIRNYRDYLQK